LDLSKFFMEGRTVFVTEGAGRVGVGCARPFALAGANVVLVDLPADALPPVVAEIEALGVEALAIAADVTNEAQVRDPVTQAMARFGRIDVLVNVAGGTRSRNPQVTQFNRAPLLDMDAAGFMAIYEANVTSGFLCAKAIVPHMQAAGSGAVVNIGSQAGVADYADPTGDQLAAYSAAKAAYHALTARMVRSGGPRCASTVSRPGCSIGVGRMGSSERRLQRRLVARVSPTTSAGRRCSWRPTQPASSTAKPCW
jgi:NAD(P)-dependent dehydrogenase (short-subunit alcohol dehydrogenase family)